MSATEVQNCCRTVTLMVTKITCEHSPISRPYSNCGTPLSAYLRIKSIVVIFFYHYGILQIKRHKSIIDHYRRCDAFSLMCVIRSFSVRIGVESELKNNVQTLNIPLSAVININILRSVLRNINYNIYL